jgi:hypothetical protein
VPQKVEHLDLLHCLRHSSRVRNSYRSMT